MLLVLFLETTPGLLFLGLPTSLFVFSYPVLFLDDEVAFLEGAGFPAMSSRFMR